MIIMYLDKTYKQFVVQNRTNDAVIINNQVLLKDYTG